MRLEKKPEKIATAFSAMTHKGLDREKTAARLGNVQRPYDALCLGKTAKQEAISITRLKAGDMAEALSEVIGGVAREGRV